MEKKQLHLIKAQTKEINSNLVDFKKLKRNTLPSPFKRMGGSRAYSSGLIPVSDDIHVLFIWRDGEILTDTAFYGYLTKTTKNNILSVFEFHWHPSHKGYHCVVPCNTENHEANRMIPKNAPELNLSYQKETQPNLDPRDASDRLKLINFFCEKINLKVISSGNKNQTEINLQ